ncbi:MAG: peptidylprolyl isomerase [Solirubrobacteraceae bacterium]|jgi:foldase protein PrsA
MKLTRSMLALGAVLACALAVAACGSGVPGNSVADVAGNPITTLAFKHWMYVAAKGTASQSPGAPVIVPTDPPNFSGCIKQVRAQIPTLKSTSDKTLKSECSQLFTSLSGQVMDFLIKSYWYQADATALHIKVTNAQVQTQFNKDKAQQFPTASAFQQFLAETGQTLQDIVFRVRVNLVYMKLLSRHSTTVTSAEIQAYYGLHKSTFGTPQMRNIRIVLAKTTAQANAAKAALAAGQSWTAVAKRYSTDPTTKNTGGLLADVTKGQQDAALNNAAFSAPANKVLGPVKADLANGYYVFEVTSIKAATQQTLAQATAQIKTLLSSQAQTTAENAVDAHAKKNWQSKTSCRSDYAISDCPGYKAPSTSTTATTATTT